MLDKKNSLQLNLFALSNFLAAFGGGIILSKGIRIIDIPCLKEGSVLAFFVGTVMGLFFTQLIPKKYSKTINQLFSIFSSLASLLILILFVNYSNNTHLEGLAAITFFCLLCVRFGFWYYSRAMRVATAAGRKQSIAWVEYGYYVGTILGLIIWSLPWVRLPITYALLIDIVLQLCAGIIDIRAHSILVVEPEKISKTDAIVSVDLANIPNDKLWSWRLICSLVFLTIGTQAIIFTLIDNVSDSLSSFIMAAFYSGVLIAALVCKRNKISVRWNKNYREISLAVLRREKNGKIKETNFLAICLSTASCVFISIYTSSFGIQDWNVCTIILLTSIIVAAYYYETLLLAILDRIGLEGKMTNNPGIMIKSFGLMGAGSGVGLWFLCELGGSFLLLTFTLVVSFILGFWIIRKREYTYQKEAKL